MLGNISLTSVDKQFVCNWLHSILHSIPTFSGIGSCDNSGGSRYSQAICIIIQLKKHLSHFSFVFLQANGSFFIYNKDNILFIVGSDSDPFLF